MTWKRLITVLIILPLGAWVVFTSTFNGLPVFIAVLLVALVIAYEIANLAEKKGCKFNLWIHSIALTLSFISFFLYGMNAYDMSYLFVIQLGLITVYILTLIVIESVSGNFEMSMESITLSLFSYLLLGIFAPLIGLIKRMDMSGWILAILLLITILTDTGGWLFGKLFGRHKVKFLSSPNKTVEGFFGAFIFGILTGSVIFILQNIFSMPTKFTLPVMAVVAFSVIMASIIGDLGESTIKRWAHMKDSSDLLPGHGGFFDRFDSLIFSTPVFFVIMKLMGY